MEEIIHEFICQGLPGHPEFNKHTYYFTVKKIYLATGEFSGCYRIEIPKTALNIEQEVASCPEQEKFIFEVPFGQYVIWDGVVELKATDFPKFLELIKSHIVN